MQARRKTQRSSRGKGRAWAALGLCGAFLCLLLAGRALCADAVKAPPAGCTLEQAKPGSGFCFPLETRNWRLSDGYGWRTDPLTGEEAFHKGVDLACGSGTVVRAALDGVVVQAKYSTSYGNYLRLCHADGGETLYAHLQYCYVRTGEVVQAGQPLGTAGQTGRATGAHLHFEVLAQGLRQDPSRLLGLS